MTGPSVSFSRLRANEVLTVPETTITIYTTLVRKSARLHSPCTWRRPRNENCRNPITDLMMPKTGSHAESVSDGRNAQRLTVRPWALRAQRGEWITCFRARASRSCVVRG
uniref:Uncharacterized protein n=1 Tax=mine drainage metagenome TaxID=410659 RepID=E6QJI3_9ZZZZ